METFVNPTNRQGERNFYCPHYRSCLDHAVQHGWEFWDCSSCESKFITAAEPMFNFSAHNPDICHSLPIEISSKIQF